MFAIQTVDFDAGTPDVVKDMKYGSNWPAVYIINNEEEAYVGETINVAIRAGQHFKKPERQKLIKLNLISDDNFNKSVILDLESFLIRYMSADEKFMLQNSNSGINENHRYYQKDIYDRSFGDIWDGLMKEGLVKHSINYIENSDLFKYSPYKSLNLDQYRVVDEIVQDLVDNKGTDKGRTILVKGGAGTGKTVLAVYLAKLLSEIGTDSLETDSEMDPGYAYVVENLQKLEKMKIGLIVPMQSLRTTIKKVFKSIKHLKMDMVMSPIQIPRRMDGNEKFDLLIVDEAHRLRQRKALSNYPSFDKNNRFFGLDNNGTELDWILRSSKNQVLFYDSMQSVKPSDVDKSRFDELLSNKSISVHELKSQFRCIGGDDYIDYVKNVLSDNPPDSSRTFGKYEFRMFDDVQKMIDAIKQKDAECSLCRTVAGYSWEWKSKKDKKAYDIFIEHNKYQWNTVSTDWVNSPNSVNEIGCIHTIQGYDLNYAGVILGNEIKYDSKSQKIYIDKSQYWDLQGKTKLVGNNDKEQMESLKSYILNIYKTMLTRGIKGTYVYVCDEQLREHLSEYIPTV